MAHISLPSRVERASKLKRSKNLATAKEAWKPAESIAYWEEERYTLTVIKKEREIRREISIKPV